MKKGCLIILIVVLVLASIALGFYFTQQNKKEEFGLKTEKPEYRDIEEKTIATGTINPRQEVEIKPQVSGVVDKIYVEEGDIVTKGQELAKIKLIPSEVSVNSARSNKELAQLRFDDARRELNRQKKVFEQNLDVENAKLSYENALVEAERQNQLYDDGVISKREYDQYKLDLELKKAAYDNAKISSQNALRQYESDLQIRQQELQSAANNLQLLREGVTKNSKQISNIITSTLDGMVLDIPVKEGSSVIERNNFNEGTSIATIANMNDLVFEGKVDESDVDKIQPGMTIKMKLGAIPDKKMNASLEHISPKGFTEEGSIKFEIRASIRQTDSTLLRAGYSANGDIILNIREQVLSINERDVIYRQDSSFVEIKKADSGFEQQYVELGISDGIYTEVISGIDSSDVVKVQNVIK
jgi:HlyD family secretion protein